MEGWSEGFLQALLDVAVDNSDNSEYTSHMHFTKHFLYPHDLMKSEQNVRQSILVCSYVKEEGTGSKQLSGFPHTTCVFCHWPKREAHSSWQ